MASSEILNISQPALSKALKLLEQEVGQKLVSADGRGLKLTAAGLLFKKETAPLLSAWLDVPKLLQDRVVNHSIKIGSFEVFTTYFLSALGQHISLEGIELHELTPGKLEEAIVERVVDVGITYAPIPKQGLDFIEVTRVRMGVFGHKKFRDVPLSELPFAVPISPNSGTPSKVVGLDGWPDHKFDRSIKFKVSMMESAMQLCRDGHAVAYLPEFVVELHNQNVIAEKKMVGLSSPLAQKERMQGVFLIRRKEDTETKLVRQIAKCLRALV